MCHQTTCRRCKKITWGGCGQHKSQVLRGVPKNQRCTCTAAQKAEYEREHSLAGRLGKLFSRS